MNAELHKITSERVGQLKQAVEAYIDRRIKTPADFTFLSDSLTEKVHKRVSPTTLKRMWGYIMDAGNSYLPGRYTLCVLSEFLGYRDFEAFLDSLAANDTPQSASFLGETINSSDLQPGTMLRVTWSPGRVVRMQKGRSLNEFEVIESVNAKLRVGDVVECLSVTQRAPLYFNSVVRAGGERLTYIAGSRTGVQFTLEAADI